MLAPSSKYLIVSLNERGPFELQLILPTGELRRLTAPGLAPGLGDLNPTIAPDGKTLAFTRFIAGFGGPIYTLALSSDSEPAGAPRLVPWAANDAVSVAWASDGSELIYQRYGEPALWGTGAFDRSTPRHLFNFAGLGSPSFSRDGLSLAFSIGRTDLDIARSEISSSLSEPHLERVISSTRVDTEARLSPDNRRIVFSSERSGSREIWVAGLDASSPRQLTDFRNAINGQPSWSPDGKMIAFDSRNARNGNGKSRIYVVPADGPGLRQVTSDSADNSLPRWSRDGKWLYFSSNRSGSLAIWKANAADFSQQRQITTQGGSGPMESPDGRYLYYVHREGVPGPQHLWRINTSTGEEERVLPSRNISWWDFVPKNDGVYFTKPPETHTARFLFFYDLGTSQIMRVASLPSSYYCCLDVSNDRRYVYYSVLQDLGHDLTIVRNFH